MWGDVYSIYVGKIISIYYLLGKDYIIFSLLAKILKSSFTKCSPLSKRLQFNSKPSHTQTLMDCCTLKKNRSGSE